MKTLSKILLLTALLLGSFSGFSINYVSAGPGPADWNTATSWSPNGIPTSVDNVTILAGHTINFATLGKTCKDLTVAGTLVWTANVTLHVYGDYVVTGTESAPGAGKLQFDGAGTVVSCTGVSSNKLYYNFNSNRTLTGSFNKTNAYTQMAANKTVTNNAAYIMGNFTAGTGTVWTNGPSSSLSLRLANFMVGKTFNAHAAGNTVTLTYATGNLPTPTAGFYNLTLASTVAGTKTMTINTVVANNLTINTNNTLNSNNFDLSVGGNWTKNGSFTASVGKSVTFNGTAAQTIAGTGTTTFERLAISNTNGVSITSGIYILNEVLTISDGTFSTGSASFTMVSTASQTARIAPITGTGGIAGNFTIQRFLSSRTQNALDSPGHWSDLSSPVQNSTFADWDNELFFYYPYNPPAEYSNVVGYDEPSYDYYGVTAGTTLTPGLGWEIALTDDATLSSFTATTLTTVGVPNQGDQDLSSLVTYVNPDGGIAANLVGNPFASSISWSSVFAASSNISSSYDEYDANAGDYATFGLGTEIGSGQGFWVYATSGGATLNIPESAKTTSSNSDVRTPVIEPYMTLNIRGDHEPSTYAHILKIAANASASDAWDVNDFPYRRSRVASAPSITSKIDGKDAKINTFNSNNTTYSMPLSTRAYVDGNYSITIAGRDFMTEYTCVTLEDTKENKWIDLSATTQYAFAMATTDNENRFVLHFSKNNDCRTMAAAGMSSDLENQFTVLPTASGNDIRFNFAETTPVTIDVMNLLGQNITEGIQVSAKDQTEQITLPADFSGMYLIRVSTENGTVVKKFMRK
jgi:hypothetical protein